MSSLGDMPVGVILAAGLATRMGGPKQLLPFGNTTVLGSVVAAARQSRLDRLILVLGAYGDEAAKSIDTTDLEVVHNPEPERGNVSSLLVATAESGTAPVLLMMGDMPGLAASVIDAHLDAWDSRPAWMRITQYSDNRGHPIVLSPEIVGGLATLRGPKPLWHMAESDRAEVLAIDAPMPIDVDTPSDYGDALVRDQRRREPTGEGGGSVAR